MAVSSNNPKLIATEGPAQDNVAASRLLRAVELTKSYAGRTVVKNVTIEVRRRVACSVRTEPVDHDLLYDRWPRAQRRVLGDTDFRAPSISARRNQLPPQEVGVPQAHREQNILAILETST
jgi:hypothetical protein